MNALLENGSITAMDCGANFSYILQDNGLFLPTEYKVLQSRVGSSFVKCMRMHYNGKVQLYYITKSLKPFSVLLPGLDCESFVTIVSNILEAVIDVKHNGFLSCQNVDISFDRFYVDPTTYKVSLVYLPVSRKIHSDYSTFENEFRSSFVKLISSVPALASPKTMQLSEDMSNGMLTIENLYSRIKGGKSGKSPSVEPPAGEVRSGVVRLVAMNVPNRVELVVQKTPYLIGKNPSAVDGAVSFNKMISRVHCRIDSRNGGFTITDLQSANGTYVNRVKLQPNAAAPIKDGDVVRLANSDFQVSIK